MVWPSLDLEGQRRSNRRLWRHLTRALEAVAGRPVAGPHSGSTELPRAARRALRRHRGRAGALPREAPYSTVKVPALAVPQLGPCASSGRAWPLWAARYSQSEAQPPGTQPPPRGLKRAASKVAHFNTVDRLGARRRTRPCARAARNDAGADNRPHGGDVQLPGKGTLVLPSPNPNPSPSPKPNQVECMREDLKKAREQLQALGAAMRR